MKYTLAGVADRFWKTLRFEIFLLNLPNSQHGKTGMPLWVFEPCQNSIHLQRLCLLWGKVPTYATPCKIHHLETQSMVLCPAASPLPESSPENPESSLPHFLLDQNLFFSQVRRWAVYIEASGTLQWHHPLFLPSQPLKHCMNYLAFSWVGYFLSILILPSLSLACKL